MSQYRVTVSCTFDVRAQVDSDAEKVALALLQSTLEYMRENEITDISIKKPGGDTVEISVFSDCRSTY